MATLIYRTRFDNLEVAREAADKFKELEHSVRMVKIRAEVREIDDAWWVYVIQEGDFVTGEEPLLLPDYERVS